MEYIKAIEDKKQKEQAISDRLEKFEKERLIKDLKESEERFKTIAQGVANEKKIKAIEDKMKRTMRAGNIVTGKQIGRAHV